MDITSTQPAASVISAASQISVAEATSRRQLLQATQTVNQSGFLGDNQLVFLVDRHTHQAVIRLVDRDTHQVVSQIPPEYVLRLAKELGGSAQEAASGDDM
jgi:uncharacterized FlaG/YvyC family protein